MKKTIPLVILTLALVISQSSFAGKPRGRAIPAKWNQDSAALYLKTLRVLDDYERGTFGDLGGEKFAPESGMLSPATLPDGKAAPRTIPFPVKKNTSFLDRLPQSPSDVLRWLMQDAYAQKNTKCLLSGYTGLYTAPMCHPDPSSGFKAARESCAKRKAGAFPCEPGLFPSIGSEPLCASATNSRWTAACSARFFDNVAGVKGNILSSSFDAKELDAVAKKLSAAKIDPAAIEKKAAALCSSIAESKVKSDVKDCETLRATWEKVAKGGAAPKVAAKLEGTGENRTAAGAPNASTDEESDEGTDDAARTKAHEEQLKTTLKGSDVQGRVNKTLTAACATCDDQTAAKNSKTGCSLNEITKNCSLLQKKDDLVLSDGTVIPSYAKDRASAGAAMRDPKTVRAVTEMKRDVERAMWAGRNFLQDVLRSMPTVAERLANGFSAADPMAAQTLSDLLNDREDGQDLLGDVLVIPEDGKTEPFLRDHLKYSELRKIFKEKLGPIKLRMLDGRELTGPEFLKDQVKFAEKVMPQYRALVRNYNIENEAAKIPKERVAKVRGLFDDVKKRMIEKLKKGKADEDLSVETKLAIERLEIVEFREPTDPAVVGLDQCGTRMPNAVYSSLNHSVMLCPSFYSQTDEALVLTMTHELTHPIDACSMLVDLKIFSIDSARVEKLAKEGSSSVSAPLLQALQARLKDCSEKKLKTCTFTPMEKDAGPLEVSGVLTRSGKPIASSDRHPMKESISCLAKKEGGGFRSNAAEVESVHASALRALDEIYGRAALTDEMKKKELEKLKKLVVAKPECFTDGKTLLQSQIDESMSDLFGAKILGEYLKDHPMKVKDPADKIGPISAYALSYCQWLDQDPVARQAEALGTLLSSSHPVSTKRVDEIVLREPEIRKALGCSEGPKQEVCSI